jgi:protein MpaA
MSLLQEGGGNDFLWRFLPAVNPDGLLDGQAVRQNASGVDLNRNFPSQDWDTAAIEYWRNNTGENPRRYPGQEAASEPEVRWLIEQIEKFEPEVIVSVHAPYHLLDFDGPSQAPDKIGDLYLHQLGVYPGSLGNYAGLDLGIPVVTLELPSAGIMPSLDQIETMCVDILDWLNTRPQNEQQAAGL